MRVNKIITLREIKNEVWRDVVYEWEDDIKENTGLEFEKITRKKWWDRRNKNKQRTLANKVLTKVIKSRSIKRINEEKEVGIAFVTILDDLEYLNKKNIIPIFIDIWEDYIDKIPEITKNLKCYFVTSLDVYNEIKKRCSRDNVFYVPLCISDRWKCDTIPNKTIDFAQTGRKSKVLHEYTMKYIEKHPELEYVYSDGTGTEGTLEYHSTKSGVIGQMRTRDDYMELLNKSKVFLLVSRNATDERTNAYIDVPTPRFYESGSQYCVMIGYHSNHEEFDIQGINDVMIRVNSYEEFEKNMDDVFYNGKTIDKDEYDKYINRHLVSNWYLEIEKIIERVV